MLDETEHQFFFTRAALSTCGRAKSSFLSVERHISRRDFMRTGATVGAACAAGALPGFAQVIADGATSKPAAAARIALNQVVIAADPALPVYVQHRVQDLRDYLAEITGAPPPLVPALPEKSGVYIVVGAKLAEQALGSGLAPHQLGAEGFLIKSQVRDGRTCVAVAGAAPAGTKFGLASLAGMISVTDTTPFIAGPLDLVSRPSIAKRGMHLNGWPMGYPHGFRSWKEADWKHYLDILTYQGVNLFYLWPFMEIMPVPLSPEDEDYLRECRRVVKYAQQQQGMEVWIMQCTNRVAKNDCGVRDPRYRPYWRPAQEDLNPGKPEHFAAIMKSRAALYRILDNVDGVCNIDSDPGYGGGSSLADYVKVLKGCRAALDQHNIHGRDTKLINWMWMGWGDAGPNKVEHQRETVRLLKQDLPEPWSLVSGLFDYLPMCREMGVLGKTVLLPYGAIEDEPSYPTTNVSIDAVHGAIERMVPYAAELAGVMGNVQTPLLQFPHVYGYLSALWDLDARHTPQRDVLLQAAALLYPERKELIADAWLALNEKDVTKLAAAAAQLESVVQPDKLGRRGVLGRHVFPETRIAADLLLAQLKYRAAREALFQTLTPTTDAARCETLLAGFLDTFLAWDLGTGWQKLWGYGPPWQLLGSFGSDPAFGVVLVRLKQALGNEAAVTACFDRIRKPLAAKYGAKLAMEGCIAPLKKAVLAVNPIHTLAQTAKASASVVPEPTRYPPSAAVDGFVETPYWPGLLVQNNTEWLQLTWAAPQTFRQVVVHFLKHESMVGRTIHLQKPATGAAWEDFATTVIPNPGDGPHAVATFDLPAAVTLDRLRIVNLLDLFEVEVR
jgi:hypothetical protein